MTPKEKAIQLFDSFEDDLMECDTYFLEAAQKRCAIIAVDEVLKAAFYAKNEIYDFYIEVKLEIQNL
jgi:hypothetical protein